MAIKVPLKVKITTKEKILKAALRCFVRKGIEQTKLIDIAEVAKIKHNLIIYHFKDFEQLCLACVEQVVHNFFQETQKISVKKQKNTSEHLEEFIVAHFYLAKQHPEAFSLWLHFYYKASVDSHYQKLFNSITVSTHEKLKSILVQYCLENKLDHLELQLELIAKHTIAQIIGQLTLTVGEEHPQYDLAAKSCYLLTLQLLK